MAAVGRVIVSLTSTFYIYPKHMLTTLAGGDEIVLKVKRAPVAERARVLTLAALTTQLIIPLPPPPPPSLIKHRH